MIVFVNNAGALFCFFLREMRIIGIGLKFLDKHI